MLSAMMQAAVNWMRAGLPLRLLKIVIYARGEASSKLNEKLIKIFDGFRSQVKNLPRVPQVCYLPLSLCVECEAKLSMIA